MARRVQQLLQGEGGHEEIHRHMLYGVVWWSVLMELVVVHIQSCTLRCRSWPVLLLMCNNAELSVWMCTTTLMALLHQSPTVLFADQEQHVLAQD